MKPESEIFSEPLAWINQPLRLFHGTTENFVESLLERVDVEIGNHNKDFGQGFYTTTSEEQALRWSRTKAETMRRSRNAAVDPAVISFEIDRLQLSNLSTLAFVRFDSLANDFWSFVHHCRRPNPTHQPPLKAYYDVVYGPVTRPRLHRAALPGYDQVSFHTAGAEYLLNHSRKERLI